MIVVWLLQGALTLLGWFLSLFSALPALALPEAFTLEVAVPLIGASGVAALNAFLPVAVAVVSALVVGKVLQWLYAKIPYKGT